jgi:hypothetical protein
VSQDHRMGGYQPQQRRQRDRGQGTAADGLGVMRSQSSERQRRRPALATGTARGDCGHRCLASGIMPACRRSSNSSIGGLTTRPRASVGARCMRWIGKQQSSSTATSSPTSQRAWCERSTSLARRRTRRCLLNCRWSKWATCRALHRVTNAPGIRPSPRRRCETPSAFSSWKLWSLGPAITSIVER